VTDAAVSVPKIQRIEPASNDPRAVSRGQNTIPDLLDAEQSLEHWKLLGHRWQRHCYSLLPL
jgi:hypothetical protein